MLVIGFYALIHFGIFFNMIFIDFYNLCYIFLQIQAHNFLCSRINFQDFVNTAKLLFLVKQYYDPN